ncbi:MAG: MBL fold metallo-hydrolase [Clostridia bacterium]|nr:MBL fold metallo-hydrolase [Clostridia bacterium]
MSTLTQYRTRASLYDGPFDATVGWAAAGMGYVLVTGSGHLTVIDGGHPEDAEDFLSLLESLTPVRPVPVDLWILTHPHGDHYGALLAIAEDPALAKHLSLHNLAYRFPAEFRDRHGHGIGYAFPHMEKILSATGAALHTPAIGDTAVIDGLTLTCLYAPEDCTPLNNPNQLSLIFTAETGGRKILFTGDAYRNTLQYVTEHTPDALPCDILQLPHHGLCDTGYEPFYRLADASTVLIPISRAGDRTMRSDMYGDAPMANRWAEEHAGRVYKAFEGTVTLPL